MWLTQKYMWQHTGESARGCAHYTSPHMPLHLRTKHDTLFRYSVSYICITFKVWRRTTGRCLSCLTVRRLLEVDVGIAQRAPRDHIPTHADGQHRAGRTEFLIQHSLRDIRVQVAHVERSHRITPLRRCVHVSGSFKPLSSCLSSAEMTVRKECPRTWGTNESLNPLLNFYAILQMNGSNDSYSTGVRSRGTGFRNVWVDRDLVF